MINTPYKQLDNNDIPERHPALQFLIFAGVFIVVLIVGTLIGMGIVMALYGLKTVMAITTLTVTAPHFVTAIWIIQLTGTTAPIFISPVMFARFLTNNPPYYLKTSFSFPWGLLLLIFALMFISNPLIELLSNINQKMVLPHWLKWMRESEDNAQKLMTAMIQMKTIWDMFLYVILVGLLTAIAEEFMFRGVIQGIFTRWTKNVHAAVWITAILFSAFHMEFFGFLPRLLLGVLFGYFVAWSGSIWTGVWAHFINNGTVVVATYLFQQKIVKGDPNDQHVFNYAGYAISFVVVLGLMLIYRKIALMKDKTPAY